MVSLFFVVAHDIDQKFSLCYREGSLTSEMLTFYSVGSSPCSHQKFLLKLLVDEFKSISLYYITLLNEHKSKSVIEHFFHSAMRQLPPCYLCPCGGWPLRGTSCLLNCPVSRSTRRDWPLCCSPMEGLKRIRRSASVSRVIIQKHGSLPGQSGQPFWHSLLSCQLQAVEPLALWTTLQRSGRCWHASML